MNGDILKVGDRVLWSHSWGTDPYKEATIESITLCEQENSKDGEQVEATLWSNAEGRHILVDFKDHDHWAWGFQIKKLSATKTLPYEVIRKPYPNDGGACICGEVDCPDAYSHWTSGY